MRIGWFSKEKGRRSGLFHRAAGNGPTALHDRALDDASFRSPQWRLYNARLKRRFPRAHQ
jgi:hypothetical protein